MKSQVKAVLLLLLSAAMVVGCGVRGAPTKEAPKSPTPEAARTPVYITEHFEVTFMSPARIADSLTVTGRARVGGASFQAVIEDGHNELVRQRVEVAKGAPEWADFTIKLVVGPASSPNGTLYFTVSGPDGTPRRDLTIPVVFEKVERNGEQSANPPAGPAAGFVAVPRERGMWSATGKSATDAARRFALDGETCDCDAVEVEPVSVSETQAIVRVRMEGLKDDSVKAEQYVVILRRPAEMWEVVSATYSVECRRGSADGLCL